MKTFISVFLCSIILVSCSNRRTTTTVTNPQTGQVTTTTEDDYPVSAAMNQPIYNQTYDYYGNSDFGWGGMWNNFGHYIYFSGPKYQYRINGRYSYYNVPNGISIYQPSARTYGYASRSSVIVNGRSIARTNVPVQRTTVNSNQGQIGINGGTTRSNGQLSTGSTNRTIQPIKPSQNIPSTNQSRSPSRAPSMSFGKRR